MSTAPSTPSDSRPSPRRLRAWALLGFVAAVGCGVAWQAQALLRADLVSASARVQILAWAADESALPSPTTWDAARADVERAMAITPGDPDLQERLGDLWLVAGKRDWASPTARRADFRQAAACYEAALGLRPGEPQTWAMLAAARQAMGDSRTEVHQAWARALALGPFEGHVQPILMQVVLADWPGATPEMQAWATHLFDAGDEGTRRDINAMAAGYGLHFAPDPPKR